MRGRFITLEGIDGSGKSTQARLLADALRARGHDVTVTREPGGTALGEGIRALLLDTPTDMAPVAEALLFAAARAQHVAELIRPKLEAGAWVICDRFVDSSLAYQGAARGLGIDTVWAINAPAVDRCMPDVTVVLDMSAHAAAARDTGPADRIESEGRALQEAVANGYRELAARFADRIVLVPGDADPDTVHGRVLATVSELT